MILCVDIGNSSIKFAVVANREVVKMAQVPIDAHANEIARSLLSVMNPYVDSAAISSVNPPVTKRVGEAVRRSVGMRPLVVTSRSAMPIAIGTRQPAKVGIDRLCAACGALGGRKRNAIIVDIGSAITVDLVLNRRFLGGLIMSGPQMALSALHQHTAQLPDLDLGRYRRDAFDDTEAAMLTGAVVGTKGAIVAAVEMLQRRAQSTVPVWLTGGHGPRFARHLPKSYKLNTGLLLIGLSEIARENHPATR